MSNIDKFTTAQVHAMEKSVYIDSEKAHRNLRLDECGRNTDDYFINWVNSHSKEFRDAWNASICKSCKKTNICYDCLKEKCVNFELDEIPVSVFEMRQEITSIHSESFLATLLKKIIFTTRFR